MTNGPFGGRDDEEVTESLCNTETERIVEKHDRKIKRLEKRLKETKRNSAVYAGSFDPPTNGHIWMIEQGARLFDKLYVAIGINPDKKYSFSVEERKSMLEGITKPYKNAEITSFENKFLVDYANEIGTKYILRGIRSTEDYEYEKGMRNINSDINQGVYSIFLIPPREISEVSSSLVKSLIGPEGWEEVVKKYVPGNVYQKLIDKFGGKNDK